MPTHRQHMPLASVSLCVGCILKRPTESLLSPLNKTCTVYKPMTQDHFVLIVDVVDF